MVYLDLHSETDIDSEDSDDAAANKHDGSNAAEDPSVSSDDDVLDESEEDDNDRGDAEDEVEVLAEQDSDNSIALASPAGQLVGGWLPQFTVVRSAARRTRATCPFTPAAMAHTRCGMRMCLHEF